MKVTNRCPFCGMPNNDSHTVDLCRIAQGKPPYPKGHGGGRERHDTDLKKVREKEKR